MVVIAAAAAGERDRRQQADLLLVVEQPPEQMVERQRGIGELGAADRLGEDADMVPFRMIEPGVQPLAPLLPFRQMLEEEAAGDPALRIEREPDQARNLLGLDEEMLGRLAGSRCRLTATRPECSRC